MASRKISDLWPPMQRRVYAFKANCRAADLEVLIYCTLRSNAEQSRLYQQGRSKPGRKVTWAKAGQSAHNYGLAIDAVPMWGGKLAWGTTGVELELWQRMGLCGEAAGLEWAGRWEKGKREFPHLQYPDWRQVIKTYNWRPL